MTQKISAMLQSDTAPLKTFFVAFVAVVVLVFGATAFVTFQLPELFASTARIKIDKAEQNQPGTELPKNLNSTSHYDPYLMQTEFEVAQSESVLGKVVDELNLRTKWGTRYADGSPLTTAKAIELLRRCLNLRPIRNTSLIEICVYDEDRNEAARIANAIVSAYRTTDDNRIKHGSTAASITIVDKAVPSTRPARPNKPLNLAIGAVGGMLIALIVGGLAALISWHPRRRPRPTSALPTTSLDDNSDNKLLVRQSPPKTTIDRAMAIFWIAFATILFGLIVFVWRTEMPTITDPRLTSDSLVLLLFGLFWLCTAFVSVFLFQGKAWARIYIGTLGLLLAFFFLLSFRVRGPLALRWIFGSFGLVTACVLLRPRKKAAA